jgi:hypothetical protein
MIHDSVKHIHTITCVNGEGIHKIVYHQSKWTSEQKDIQINLMLNKLPLSSKIIIEFAESGLIRHFFCSKRKTRLVISQESLTEFIQTLCPL